MQRKGQISLGVEKEIGSQILEVFGGPGGFLKVQEAGRRNFLHISCKSSFMVPKNEQKIDGTRSCEDA